MLRFYFLLSSHFGLDTVGLPPEEEVHAKVDNFLFGRSCSLLLDLGLLRDEVVQGQRSVVKEWRGGGGRVVVLLVLHLHPHVFPHLPLGPPPPEVSLLEIVHTGGVDGPVVTLPIGCTSSFQEEIIEREIVSDGVPPALTSVSEVGEIIKNVLVDVRQHQLLLRVAEDGHRYQPNVGVLGLGLVREGNPEEPRVELGHGEHGQVGWGTEPLVDDGQGGRAGLQEGRQRVGELRQGGQQSHSVSQRQVVQLAEVQRLRGEAGRGGGGRRVLEHGEGEGGR